MPRSNCFLFSERHGTNGWLPVTKSRARLFENFEYILNLTKVILLSGSCLKVACHRLLCISTPMASVVIMQSFTSPAHTRIPSFRPMYAATHKGNDTGSQNGTNYFIGVLFAFAVLVLAVVACAMGSSRRSSRRQALRRQTLDPWTESGSKGDVKPPRLYDMGYTVVQDAAVWKVMMVRFEFLYSYTSSHRAASISDMSCWRGWGTRRRIHADGPRISFSDSQSRSIRCNALDAQRASISI